MLVTSQKTAQHCIATEPNFFQRSPTAHPVLTAQSSFGGYGIESLVSPPYHAPHRQRLLLFRYSRMNQKNPNCYDSLIRQPLVGNDNRKVMFTRAGSLDSPPKAPPRRIFKRDTQYQTMADDNSIDDSDGSNMTSITTTTTGD